MIWSSCQKMLKQSSGPDCVWSKARATCTAADTSSGWWLVNLEGCPSLAGASRLVVQWYALRRILPENKSGHFSHYVPVTSPLVAMMYILWSWLTVCQPQHPNTKGRIRSEHHWCRPPPPPPPPFHPFTIPSSHVFRREDYSIEAWLVR